MVQEFTLSRILAPFLKENPKIVKPRKSWIVLKPSFRLSHLRGQERVSKGSGEGREKVRKGLGRGQVKARNGERVKRWSREV